MEAFRKPRHSDAVYLHFLDRELTEAAGRLPYELDLIQATRLLTFFTQSELYCGLSAIWENHRLSSRTHEEFEVLLSCHELQTVSRDATLAEFRTSRSDAYQHDAERYANYYTADGDKLSWLVPTWPKSGGSTAPLLETLRAWTESIPMENLGGKFQPALHALREPTREALFRRENQAITYNYFRGFLGDLGGNPHVEYTIRRQISKGFTVDNQRHGGGDIATGIRELVYFDQLSTDFPQHDVQVLLTFATVCNISSLFAPVEIDAEHWLSYVRSRRSLEVELLADTVRWLLTAMYDRELDRTPSASEDEATFHGQHQVRRRIVSQIREAARVIGRPGPPDPHMAPQDVARLTEQHLMLLADQLSESDPALGANLEKSRGALGMPHADVLLITVNEIETKELRAALERTGHQGRNQYGPINTYWLYGPIGGATVAHVRCSMGSGGQGGSMLTVQDAILDLRPSAVIGVGVAFGIDEKRQPIGEVLLSEKLTSYEPQRVGTGPAGILTITRRGPSAECSPRLLGRFRDAHLDDLAFRVKSGELLSGEKLIDNPDFKRSLLDLFPEAIGGEMEGAGVNSASGRAGVEWIIVKAICDYAAEKAVDKIPRQELAARNASLVVVRALEAGGLIQH
ncbi:hypothetical protein VA596_09570 [Amycolatopsis sp., V23-08]|uniref:Nucleoside phosphorylase domain-containing protein n=1 Tax=Amycolatopsis heterodermiae TaxID=3110235 RepID=A0ABU5R241_9PSEU|nr:hypothetical protein [Amycolatopsis sp., V23-08]MEA5359785.1 hypothetical protein [Amycolatopsis sp., V23-08]